MAKNANSSWFFRSYTFLLLSCCTFIVSNGQNTPQHSLLALSKTDHTLAIVDPTSLKVIKRIPVGVDPHEVIASADGTRAYVSIYGGGSLHEIDVIDLVAQKPLSPIETKPLLGPHGLTYVGGKLWFTVEGSKSIGRYDPATGKIDWAMGTGQDRTHMIYVTDNERNVYTTNVASGTVSILTDTTIQPPPSAPAGAKPREDWIHTVIPVSKGSEGFDVSPDGKQIWAAASDDGSIAIIDIPSKKVIGKIDAKANGANRLIFSKDGKLVFVTSLRSSDLFIIDTETRTLLKRVYVGHGAAGILADHSGSRVFVACTPDNYIAIINLKMLEVEGHLDVGGGPDGLAWADKK
jgi:YVTN family beta-propeller protein